MSFYDDASLIFLAGAAAGKDGKAYNVKPVPVYGPELVTNGDFATDSDWNKEASWSISGGTANYSGVSNALITQINLLPQSASATLKVQWTQTITSGTRLRFFARNYNDSSSSGITVVSVETTGDATYQSGNCNFSGTFTAIVTTTDGFSFKMLGEAGNVGSIDNVSVQEVIKADGDFTFSRGSNLSATRVGPDGLIEKGRENLLTQNNTFSSSNWTKFRSTITSGESGYDGSSDAWKWNETAEHGEHQLRQAFARSGVNCLSIYAKAAERDVILFRMNLSSYWTNVFFNLTSGSVVSTGGFVDATITSVGNGWYRCEAVFNNLTGGTIQYQLGLNNTTYSYTGESGKGIFVQDAQAEIGLAATELIESGASTGKAGLLEDEPRFDYSRGATCPSLLLEPSRTNLVQSEYFDGQPWETEGGKQVVTQSVIISPDGTKNGSKLETFDGTYNQRKLWVQKNVASGQPYTFSVYIKQVSGQVNTGFLHITTGANDTNDASQAYTATNEWQRVSVTTTSAKSAVIRFLITGDSNAQIYIYGAQAEQGSYPTSYIPNHSGGSVTRGGDVCDGNVNASNFNDTEGVLYAEVKINAISGVINIKSSTGNNYGYISPTSNNRIRFAVRDTQGLRYNDVNSYVDDAFNKIILKYDSNGFYGFINGAKVLSNTNATTSFTGIDKMSFEFGNNDYYGLVKQSLYFPTALSDTDCTILTGTSYDTFADMAEALNYTVYE